MKRIPLLSILFVFAVTFTLQNCAFAQNELSDTEVRKILKATGDHLAKMQEDSGRYKYEYNPFTDEYTNDDFIVRQVAAVISMSELYDVFKDEIYLTRMKKTADYWLSKSATIAREGKTLRYFPEPTRNNNGELGSNALFLIGTRVLKEKDPVWWTSRNTQIQEVENAVLWLEKANGGFAQKITSSITKEEKEKASASDYYDGEAMLALLTIYKYDPRPEIKEVIFRTLSYFERTYTKAYATGLYLWAMRGMNLGYELFKDERFVKFADQHQYLRESVRPITKPSFANNTCAALEGYGHWLLLHHAKGEKKEKQQDYYEASLRRTAKLQLNKNSEWESSYGGITDSIRPLAKGMGGFLTSLKKPVLRIDFQQHCISAYKPTLSF